MGSLLAAHQNESDTAVLEAQAFAFGQLAHEDAEAVLRVLAESGEAVLRARAAEALGKLGRHGLEPVLTGMLADADASVAGEAALALARLIGRRVQDAPPLEPARQTAVLAGLEALIARGAGDTRWQAVYALSELEALESAPRLAALEAALVYDEAPARLFAVRALTRAAAEAENATERSPAAALIDDPDPHVAAAAIASLGKSDGGDALAAAAERRVGPSDFHRRAAALAVGDPPRSLIEAGLEDPSLTVRRVALQRAAEDAELGPAAIGKWAKSENPWERAAAASAARALAPEGAKAILSALAGDPDPRAVTAALGTLVGREELHTLAYEVAVSALEREDLAIRGTALASLRELGSDADLPLLVAVYNDASGDENVELRVEALRSALALAGAAASELIERGLEDPALAVRTLAAEAHEEHLGSKAQADTADASGSSVEVVVQEDFRTGEENPRVVIETNKGEIELQLYPDEAPRHVRSFLDWMESGRYNGLGFHRVVGGFVIQGLDSRGDGWGTGGVRLRDEINPIPYRRGALGMPNAGPDTGGCQIFITHVPTPHLDGRYTVFGQVISGLDVVDAIEVGDEVLRVRRR